MCVFLLTLVDFFLFGVELIPNGEPVLEELRLLLELPFASDSALLGDGSGGGSLGSGTLGSLVFFLTHCLDVG